MRIGYVRVSTKEQNTIRQEVLMEQLNVDRVFIDKQSGKNIDRAELNRAIEFVREGDILIVESISRFARNTKHLLELIDKLNEKHVQFISLKENIDTNTSAGKFMLTVFSAVAELELEYIKQRQREGIDIAIEEGRYNGRPKKTVNEEVIQAWLHKEITATKASKTLGLSRSTFYRKAKEFKSNDD